MADKDSRWARAGACVQRAFAQLVLAGFASGAALQPAYAQEPAAGFSAPGCRASNPAGSLAEQLELVAALAAGDPRSTTLRPLAAPPAAGSGSADGPAPRAACSATWLPWSAAAWYNTAQAHADRDGAVWQGRGLTAAATGGFQAAFGALSVRIQPLATFAENRAFLPETGATPGSYSDPFVAGIDLPYRFGDSPLFRVEPGESQVLVSHRGASLGFGTMSQQWGPAHFYPLVMGTEAAGYPRVHAEVRSVPVGIGAVTAHWHVGWLEASPYSGLAAGQRSRYGSAATGSMRFRGLPGVEVGATRFFHVRRDGSMTFGSVATLPFSGLLKVRSRDVDVGGFNQLASVFLRVAPPRSGGEVYGELYREDHNVDTRDLIGEPDHISAWVIGVRRAWHSRTGVNALTIERANGRISHLIRVRSQGPIHIHTPITEGHTYRGQPIGSSGLIGGGGSTLAFTRVQQQRVLTFRLESRARAQSGEGGLWQDRRLGHYAGDVSVVQRGSRGNRAYGIGVQSGYGDSRRVNLTLRMGVSR